MRKPRGIKARKIVVPVVLTIAVSTGAVAAVTTALGVVVNAGCGGDDGPPPVDAMVDTPII